MVQDSGKMDELLSGLLMGVTVGAALCGGLNANGCLIGPRILMDTNGPTQTVRSERGRVSYAIPAMQYLLTARPPIYLWPHPQNAETLRRF